MTPIDLGPLKQGPHAEIIQAMADACAADPTIQAIWVGGSLAAGTGDIHSDVDFRIAVEADAMSQWTEPNWDAILPDPAVGGQFMPFGDQALLHHLVLANGTIVDFYVQTTSREYAEPEIVILACRNAEFRARLERFARPAASLIKEIEGDAARRFLIEYWITTHKQVKALARRYDLSPFVGLYFERIALLRAWYMQVVGKDVSGRPSLHLLKLLHAGLEGKLTPEQQAIVGLPSQTPEETAAAIEAIRAEMARIGRELAARHQFEYPAELETVVQTVWQTYRPSALTR